MRRIPTLSSVALLLACIAVPLVSGAAEVVATYQSKRDPARTAYETRLYNLARTALQNGLGEEGMMFLREIVVRDPEHKKARDLAKQLEEYLAKRGPLKLATQQQRQLDARRKSMNALADRERQKYVRQVASLAKWCASNKYDAGLSESIDEGLALDPDCLSLRQLKDEKKHKLFGWLASDVVGELDAGKWRVDDEWKPWNEVSSNRVVALKERDSELLGGGFRYTASYHFTIASSLKDRTFDTTILDALETLIRLQYEEFYSDFRVGLEPYNVLYFESQNGFKAYLPKAHMPHSDSMGFYSPSKRTLYVWRHFNGNGTNGVGTAFHEATHGTMRDFFGSTPLPTWLDEGLASFHEKSRPTKTGFCFGAINIPRMRTLIDELEGGAHLTLDTVFDLKDEWNENIMYAYNVSAMFMHFLYDSELLKPFIKEMAQHGDADKAVLAVLGPDRGAWDKMFDSYVHEELLNPKAREKMYKRMEGKTID